MDVMMGKGRSSDGVGTTSNTTTTSSSVGSDSRRLKKKVGKFRRKPYYFKNQKFANYLSFGISSTCCLCLFLSCYVIVLLSIWPLIMTTQTQLVVHKIQHNGEELKVKEIIHVPDVILSEKSKEKIGHIASQSKEKIDKITSNMKQKLQQFRQGNGITDSELLIQAEEEFEKYKHNKNRQLRKNNNSNDSHKNNYYQPHPNGIIVLGMHRSGTSMLSGLLVQSCGYNVGGPLIGAAFDNAKGFYERVDVVLQNDEFMKYQNIWWSANVMKYDYKKALEDKQYGIVSFEHGKPGLEFLNSPKNIPYIQKDPRMCITLKTWLELLNHKPAILFTYRHPLEVALSLQKREKDFKLERGLRLWIIYNMRAIQNSNGLCRITSSNTALLDKPLEEVQRIVNDVTTKCNVPSPPTITITQDHIDEFIDPSLQHNTNERKLKEEQYPILEKYNNDKCIVRDYQSDYEKDSSGYVREHTLYRKAMKIYCDFESGLAYQENYIWPELSA